MSMKPFLDSQLMQEFPTPVNGVISRQVGLSRIRNVLEQVGDNLAPGSTPPCSDKDSNLGKLRGGLETAQHSIPYCRCHQRQHALHYFPPSSHA